MQTLFYATAALYLGAAAAFLVLLVRGVERAGRVGMGALMGAALLHAGSLAVGSAQPGPDLLSGIRGTLSVLALVLVVAYLVSALRFRVAILGAFVTPLALVFFVTGGLGRDVAEVPGEVRSALVPVHVGLNVLGLVAFALAFAVAVAYLIQENLLRRKRISGLFQRLPPLDDLDALGLRLVTVGFPLLTLGIITGSVWAVRLDPDAPAISAAQGFALLAWFVFASVLLLRVAAGWRGRRAAIGTMLGFFCTLAVLTGYVLRTTGGEG